MAEAATAVQAAIRGKEARKDVAQLQKEKEAEAAKPKRRSFLGGMFAKSDSKGATPPPKAAPSPARPSPASAASRAPPTPASSQKATPHRDMYGRPIDTTNHTNKTPKEVRI